VIVYFLSVSERIKLERFLWQEEYNCLEGLFVASLSTLRQSQIASILPLKQKLAYVADVSVVSTYPIEYADASLLKSLIYRFSRAFEPLSMLNVSLLRCSPTILELESK
jgi:hypothetical protein